MHCPVFLLEKKTFKLDGQKRLKCFGHFDLNLFIIFISEVNGGISCILSIYGGFFFYIETLLKFTPYIVSGAINVTLQKYYFDFIATNGQNAIIMGRNLDMTKGLFCQHITVIIDRNCLEGSTYYPNAA